MLLDLSMIDVSSHPWTSLSFRRPQNAVAAVGDGGVGAPVVVDVAVGDSVVAPHVAPAVDGDAVVYPVDDIAFLAQPRWPTKRGRATTPTAGGTR